MDIVDETIKLLEKFDGRIYDSLYDELYITPEQNQYFKDTKIRDENGELLVVYHGTNIEFDIFDKEHIKTGSAGGDGFYFTPNRADAISYSAGSEIVYSCFLNITNPFIYRYHTDYNKINDLYKEAYENKMKFEEYLQSKGYDGIILTEYGRDDMYIAFEPNQIKSIYNENPTSSNNMYENFE